MGNRSTKFCDLLSPTSVVFVSERMRYRLKRSVIMPRVRYRNPCCRNAGASRKDNMAVLGDVAVGRDNNFNFLRMVAASAVLISHAYPISLGIGAAEPLSASLGMTLGTLAIVTFFSISGFFISQSFDRRKNLTDFFFARALRIYPGLICLLIVTIFALGPIFTTLEYRSYLTSPSTLSYLPRNLSLKFMQYALPGVFLDNPYPTAINGSLGSLFFEVCCYFLVVVVGKLTLEGRRRWRVLLMLALYVIGYIVLKLVDQEAHIFSRFVFLGFFHHLTLPFIVGMALYQFRRLVPINIAGCALAVVVAGAAFKGVWFHEVFVISWAYVVFYFGYLRFPPLTLYNRIGDYSYGMYIYAFPVEQSIAAIWRGVSPFEIIALSFPATLVIAMMSWHLLEGPLLRRRATAVALFERLLSKTAITTAVGSPATAAERGSHP
jgi:peptidoglycan/LPS O-acetylase OafA/YrhL